MPGVAGGALEESDADLLAELEDLVREEQEAEVLSTLANAPSVPVTSTRVASADTSAVGHMRGSVEKTEELISMMA